MSEMEKPAGRRRGLSNELTGTLAVGVALGGLMLASLSDVRLEIRHQTSDLRAAIARLDDRVRGLEVGLGLLEVRFTSLEERVGEVEGRLGEVEGRLGHVEGRLGNVEGRLGDVERRLGDVEERLGEQAVASSGRTGDMARSSPVVADPRLPGPTCCAAAPAPPSVAHPASFRYHRTPHTST